MELGLKVLSGIQCIANSKVDSSFKQIMLQYDETEYKAVNFFFAGLMENNGMHTQCRVSSHCREFVGKWREKRFLGQHHWQPSSLTSHLSDNPMRCIMMYVPLVSNLAPEGVLVQMIGTMPMARLIARTRSSGTVVRCINERK